MRGSSIYRDFGTRGISARHHSRNIGAPLEATGFLNWVSKDVTLRWWWRDAITGTASYCDSSRGYRNRQGMGSKVKRSFEASWVLSVALRREPTAKVRRSKGKMTEGVRGPPPLLRPPSPVPPSSSLLHPHVLTITLPLLVSLALTL